MSTWRGSLRASRAATWRTVLNMRAARTGGGSVGALAVGGTIEIRTSLCGAGGINEGQGLVMRGAIAATAPGSAKSDSREVRGGPSPPPGSSR